MTASHTHGVQTAAADAVGISGDKGKCCGSAEHQPSTQCPPQPQVEILLEPILDEIAKEQLPGDDMQETRDATFARLRKEWEKPPVALIDKVLPTDWWAAAAGCGEEEDQEQQKLLAARRLIFDPPPAMMAHYPRLIADAATLKLQVPTLTLFYLKHVRSWSCMVKLRTLPPSKRLNAVALRSTRSAALPRQLTVSVICNCCDGLSLFVVLLRSLRSGRLSKPAACPQ